MAVLDIARRYRYKVNANKRHQEFTNLIERADMIVYYDTKGRLVHANQAFEHLIG